jgi:hypothetical protein
MNGPRSRPRWKGYLPMKALAKILFFRCSALLAARRLPLWIPTSSVRVSI